MVGDTAADHVGCVCLNLLNEFRMCVLEQI